jgi:hypothetical protein
VVQSGDTTLHLVQGTSTWTLVPDLVSDSELSGLNPVGEIDRIVGAQPGPLHVVQTSDGILFAVNAQNAWTLVPDQISDSDLAGLDQSGEIDGVIPAELLGGPPPQPAATPTSTPTPTIAAAPAGTCGVVAAGLVGRWPAEGTAKDVVGGNDGELVGGARFAPGLAGQAFSFNGKGQYVRLPMAQPLTLGGPITVVFWMRADPSNPLACC